MYIRNVTITNGERNITIEYNEAKIEVESSMDEVEQTPDVPDTPYISLDFDTEPSDDQIAEFCSKIVIFFGRTANPESIAEIKRFIQPLIDAAKLDSTCDPNW